MISEAPNGPPPPSLTPAPHRCQEVPSGCSSADMPFRLFITFRIRSQLLNMPRKKCKRSFLALAPVFLGGTVPYTFFPLSPPPASSSHSLPFSAPPPSPTLDNKHFTWALASVPWEDCPKCHRFAHGSLPCAPPHHCHWVLCCTCICYSAGLRRTRGECLPHPWIPEDAQGPAQSRYGIYIWMLADPGALLSCSSVDSLILDSAPLLFSPCTWCFSPEVSLPNRKRSKNVTIFK